MLLCDESPCVWSRFLTVSWGLDPRLVQSCLSVPAPPHTAPGSPAGMSDWINMALVPLPCFVSVHGATPARESALQGLPTSEFSLKVHFLPSHSCCVF